MNLDLLSTMNRVETPFIIAEFGGVSFGVFDVNSKNVVGSNNSPFNAVSVTYPNFMRSLTVTKINGAINTYTLQMVYQITHGDDPNLLDKIFSKAKKDRTIYLSYGDLSTPTYIYKREKAIMTDVKSNIDFAGSKITYTVYCTSSALLGTSSSFNFPRRNAKPSDVIKELLYNNIYGLLDIFTGMKNKLIVSKYSLIASDDKPVVIQAKQNITPIDYLQYLVKCMIPNNQNSNSVINNSMYRICVVDDITDTFGGAYFKVVKVSQNIRKDSLNVYTIDVGYPDNNMVFDFTIDDNQAFSILYDYSKEVDQPQYIQRIDNQGNLISEYSPSFSNSKELLRTTSEDKTWWTNMVNYPIKATIRLKGLLKPAVLMSYIYIDARFYGAQHYSSGYYLITKQVDEINSSGYRTALSLLKVGGESISGYQSNY